MAKSNDSSGPAQGVARPAPRSSRLSVRLFVDRWAGRLMAVMTVLASLLVLLIAIGLYVRSRPILAEHSLFALLSSSTWRPAQGQFGLLPFVVGSLVVTAVAMIIAVPLCLLSALYLTEYARPWVRRWMNPLIDLLAGIPSVVYGVWGILVVVPAIKNYLAPWWGSFSTGYSVLAAGVVLALMIVPVIIHVSTEVLAAVPKPLREASWSLGATRWQTIKHVVLRRAAPGIVAAVGLGLSRAFGETMAVLMVAGNVAQIPKSLFGPAYPLPALVANNYGEMMSIPGYDSALLLACLVLLGVVLVFNLLSRLILVRLERNLR